MIISEYHDNIKILIPISSYDILAWMLLSVEGLDILIYHDNIKISIQISSYDILAWM